MRAILSTASPIIRLLLAAVMVIGSLGAAPAAFDGGRADRAHHVQDASAHDCCDPEPATPDGSCGLTCAQAGCGWATSLPTAGWPAPADRQADRWWPVSIVPDDIAPETATPPPRA
jgi:hypothetical protein